MDKPNYNFSSAETNIEKLVPSPDTLGCDVLFWLFGGFGPWFARGSVREKTVTHTIGPLPFFFTSVAMLRRNVAA
jgi:hypothetical protein